MIVAKILVCLSNSLYVDGEYKIVCFYDQFIDSLKQAGNDILVFIPNIFNKASFNSNNILKKHVKENPLRQEIEDFAPDVVISFNNANYHDILSITSCPIILWTADLVWLWNQKKLINTHIGRYIFFMPTLTYMEDIRSNFKNIKDSQIHIVPSATSLQKQNVTQDKNISFIGSSFGMCREHVDFVNMYSATSDLEKLLCVLNKNPFLAKEDMVSDLDNLEFCEAFNAIQANPLSFFSDEKRINILNALCDLGLHLYGVNWDKITNVLPSLGARYHKQKIYTGRQNQDIYNSSKLCVNIMHEQGRDGIPWRVHDIMACNGCLVSKKSKTIEELFGKYIKLPVFENHYQARELCQKLLGDEAWRQDIVQAGNMLIEEDGRWPHRFKQMEEILGISLLNHNTQGSIKVLQPIVNTLYRLLHKLSIKARFSEIRDDIRYKIWKYLDKRLRRNGIIS